MNVTISLCQLVVCDKPLLFSKHLRLGVATKKFQNEVLIKISAFLWNAGGLSHPMEFVPWSFHYLNTFVLFSLLWKLSVSFIVLQSALTKAGQYWEIICIKKFQFHFWWEVLNILPRADVAPLVGSLPRHRKVADLILSQGIRPGCGRYPQ